MATKDKIIEELAAFLHTTVLQDAELELDEQTELIETGVLDSFTMEQLAEHASSVFKVEIAADDVSPKNFATLGRISQLVLRNANGAHV